MTKGERVEVRASGHTTWKAGEISFASSNGKSLAINLNESLGVGRGMWINWEEGCVELLLLDAGEGYYDVASGEPVEIREVRA